MIRVWDPLVRICHWALVVSFAVAWLTAEGSEQLHSIFGYTVGGLVVARAVWGLIGTRYARFAQFVRPPRAVLAYLRAVAIGKESRCIGHNPAGGAMIVALLIGLCLTACSGWLLTTDAFWGSDLAQSAHAIVAYTVTLMIVLHVAGVVLASARHRENLVAAMIFGTKRPPSDDDID